MSLPGYSGRQRGPFSTRLTKSTKNGATDNEADNNKKMLEALEKLVTAMPNEDAAPSEAN